jgi:hypothetical protein
MEIKTHSIGNLRIAEIVSNEILISSVQDGLDLLGNLYSLNFDGVILKELNITPDFFNLRTGIAGEILQKFSNYSILLAIVGDFAKYQSKSLDDFIRESNRGGQISFVDSVSDAIVHISDRLK